VKPCRIGAGLWTRGTSPLDNQFRLERGTLKNIRGEGVVEFDEIVDALGAGMERIVRMAFARTLNTAPYSRALTAADRLGRRGALRPPPNEGRSCRHGRHQPG